MNNSYWRNENKIYAGSIAQSFCTIKKGAVRDYSDVMNIENALYAAGWQLLGNALVRDAYGCGDIICQYNDSSRNGFTQQEFLFFTCAYFHVSRLIYSSDENGDAEVKLCFYLTKLGKAMGHVPAWKRYIEKNIDMLAQAFTKAVESMNNHVSKKI